MMVPKSQLRRMVFKMRLVSTATPNKASMTSIRVGNESRNEGKKMAHHIPNTKGINILTKGYLLQSAITSNGLNVYRFILTALTTISAAFSEAPALPNLSRSSS